MTDTAIRVENLSKRYRIGGPQERYKTLRDTIMDAAVAPFERVRRLGQPTPPEETIWALKDVSFEVKQGEVVGIIGRNGAGKTTLLKVLSRITEPTEGQAEIHGRVGSLLEVGTGFHPELTGRENICLNGAILGMRRTEIDKKFDEIVGFAEIEKFLDTPVKRYSSGMYVRLAFAVAAHLEPEVLLVDEVLAVGDAAFQKKCLDRMGDVAREGRTVLFVSHNMAAVKSLCTRTILLNDGIVRRIDATPLVIDDYLSIGGRLAECPLAERTDRRGNGDFKFTSIAFVDDDGQTLGSISTGQTLNIRLGYKCRPEIRLSGLRISIGFRDTLGQFLFNCPSDVVGPLRGRLASTGSLICRIPRLPLPEGAYRFNLFSSAGRDVADWVEDAGLLQVHAGDFYGTGRLPPQNHYGVLVEFDWRIAEADEC